MANFFRTALTMVCARLAAGAHAQPPAPSGATTRSRAIHALDDLDPTLAFYREIFGISGSAQDFANLRGRPLGSAAARWTLRVE